MAHFDKAAQYLVKQDSPGFCAWLWRPWATLQAFAGWLDTRRGCAQLELMIKRSGLSPNSEAPPTLFPLMALLAKESS